MVFIVFSDGILGIGVQVGRGYIPAYPLKLLGKVEKFHIPWRPCNIYLHEWLILMGHVGKYTMDPMGMG